MTSAEDEEILHAFLEESRENLDQLDHDLVDLEARPDDPELLGAVFRAIHTIKGTCGFLGFPNLESLAHAGEDVLGELRAGSLVIDTSITTSLLRLIDEIRAVLHTIASSGEEPDDDHAAVIADLARHLGSDARVPTVDNAVPTPEESIAVVSPGIIDGDTTVRVEVAVLDRLQDLVAELMLVRGKLGDVIDDDDSRLAQPYYQLRLVTGELRDEVTLARLQPVGASIGRLRRIARDVATALGKQVRVEIDGEDVGVDKAVNEALRDPLLHLVRNAIDHGFESPDERIRAGKAAEGVLHIHASHVGGRVHIVVTDDGRGIDVEHLVGKAIATGVVTADIASGLTRDEQLELIFRPGLSTRDEVTAHSGRGVGMDVVRTNLTRAGGTVEVSSEPGRGTEFRVSVPLTLAIIPAVIVHSGGARYAIPQADVHGVLQDTDDLEGGRYDVGDVRFHRRRGQLLPLVRLDHLLGTSSTASTTGSAGLIVVVESRGGPFGLVVDAIGDATDAVVKPLPPAIRSIPVFAGVTILGDGAVALILDVAGLASAADVERLAPTDDELDDEREGIRPPTLLLATATDGCRVAVPLEVVHRLELFDVDEVQRSGAVDVVHYRDQLLPLLPISGGTGPSGRSHANGATSVRVIVCTTSVGLVGLVVGEVDDVSPDVDILPQPSSRLGVTASLVIDGRVTELLDVELLVAGAGLLRTA